MDVRADEPTVHRAAANRLLQTITNQIAAGTLLAPAGTFLSPNASPFVPGSTPPPSSAQTATRAPPHAQPPAQPPPPHPQPDPHLDGPQNPHPPAAPAFHFQPPDQTRASTEIDPCLTTLPTDHDLLEILTPILVRFHVMSRPLLGLIPNAYMSKRQVVSWEIEKQKTRVILKKALDNYPSDRAPTEAEELALVNAVLSLLNLFAAKLPAVKGVTQYHQDVTIHMPDGSTTTISIKGRQKEARASAPHGPDGEDLAHMDAYSIRDRELTREADADVKAAERAIRIGREY